tara:strand:- start:120 stop:311 length:192 start_codon:yes stop_codon:yes gene_type:complete
VIGVLIASIMMESILANIVSVSAMTDGKTLRFNRYMRELAIIEKKRQRKIRQIEELRGKLKLG